MRGQTPTVHCDAEDGECGNWDVDFYAATATSVGGVRITSDQVAPGWSTSDDRDLCPKHARAARGES